jgi:hypothetical protein
MVKKEIIILTLLGFFFCKSELLSQTKNKIELANMADRTAAYELLVSQLLERRHKQKINDS